MSTGGSLTDGAAARRLKPSMVSLRLHVLDFVHEYIGRLRESPSLGEIAAHMGISRKHAANAVASLVKSGLLIKRAGVRGLVLPDQRDQAIRLLSTMGFQVVGQAQVVTKSALLSPSPIEYTSPPSRGGKYGGQRRKKAEQGQGTGQGA